MFFINQRIKGWSKNRNEIETPSKKKKKKNGDARKIERKW